MEASSDSEDISGSNMSDSDLELDHQEEEEFGARPYMFEPEMSSDSDGNNSDDDVPGFDEVDDRDGRLGNNDW